MKFAYNDELLGMISTEADKRPDYPVLKLQGTYDDACNRAYWTKDAADIETRDRLFYRLLAERKAHCVGGTVQVQA